MQAFAYPALLTPDEDGRLVVTFRDFPAGATDGANCDEAMHEAVDFLESALAQAVRADEDIPLPSAPVGDEIAIAPSAVTAAQVALYTAMRRGHVSAEEIAKRLNTDADAVRRLTDLSQYPPLEQIERALAALGHRLTVALDAAE